MEDIPHSVYQEINGELVREAALGTKGSGGPSGVDPNGFKRISVCKSFKRSSTNLCEAIATLTRRLCSEFVDPLTIEPIVASRPIPLDKGNGEVRPIGVGEVIRRIIGKCVTRVVKQDMINASGATQVCAGQKSGGEAAVHAMRSIFQADETDAALLIDASNAFNSLNRAAALNNIRVLCPLSPTYVTNTYRVPARLFVVGGSELKSAERTTQGDPLAMSVYAISSQPLISLLHNRSTAKQCWFADDAAGAGSLEEVKKWWEELVEAGPPLGYYPNSKKCWLVVKPGKEGRAKEMFAGTGINITTGGRKHLGAALGSRSHLDQYVGGKVGDWVGEVTKLAEFARSQQQASYAAFTFGLRHRWTYFIRTLRDIGNLLQPLERAISDVLLPSLIGRKCSEAERDLVAFPVRMGGLGLINLSKSADVEHSASIRVSAPLVSKIEAQSHETPEEAEVQRLVYATWKEKDDGLKEEFEEVKAMLPEKTQRAVDLACEKGASNWLTVIPLKDMDFGLNKREFRDAMRPRYDWPIPDNPSVCVCGSMFTVDHTMICQRGGLVIQRHNEIRDLQAELLDMVCYDLQVEPALCTTHYWRRACQRD